MRSLATLVLASVFVAGCTVARVVREEGTEGESISLADEFAAGQEAREWLAREDVAFFEISKEAGREIVEKLYAAGSPLVKITDSEKLDPNSKVEIAATIMAEMPSDKAAREKLLKLEQEIYEEESPEQDEGQKYLVIMTD